MDQIINRVLAKLQITVGPMGKNENPAVMSHVPANIFEWLFWQLEKTPTLVPCCIGAGIVKKAKGKSLKLPPFWLR